MKTRHGFVSNSSSTSFCIYGTYMPTRDLFNHLSTVLGIPFENIEDRWGNISLKVKDRQFEPHEAEDIFRYVHQELGTVCQLLPRVYCSYEDPEECYVGLAWDNIQDQETGLEFKQRVQATLTTLCGPGIGSLGNIMTTIGG